jgi:selenide,water dikinase
MDNIRLTQMVKSAGCAAKLFPNILSEALSGLDWKTNENVLVGLEGKDDAGVYRINDKLALIHTTDFFTPVVDDPYVFGKIAAANSLSDVYAMGGVPINALNIVAYPQTEDIKILKEIFRGGLEKANEAGCIIIGGHSIDIPSIVYGLSVTGTINPKYIIGNNTSKVGDILILTKGLGTGFLNNCIKYNQLENDIYNSLISSMMKLNKNASELMIKYKANSCTDVTGFGLAGHSMQMALASRKVFKFNTSSLPVLKGVTEAIQNNMLTRGDKSNRFYTQEYVINKGNVDKITEHILYDPQTSGGLLISVPEQNAEKLLRELHSTGEEMSRIVGEVQNPNEEFKCGSLIFNFES